MFYVRFWIETETEWKTFAFSNTKMLDGFIP